MLTPTTSQFLGEMESVPRQLPKLPYEEKPIMVDEEIAKVNAWLYPELTPRTFSQMLPRPDEYFCL